jgi:MYXO-CTERM domain-containing protein
VRALAFAALLLVPANAFAAVTQPNGLVVPRPSANDKEKNLDKFFAERGEAIDWRADASTTPDTFAPLCGFTAEFVLNEAGNKYGLSWYNVDPAATAPPTDLYEILKPNTPVGTKILGADIAKDPRFRGGLIGFALVGGQTHYSERKWNPVCTACTPAAPWILSLTYQSKKAENAYYLCFEDGNVTGTNFGNDGDYNDDVFLITGVQCPGAGTRCDTGLKGLCALGSNSCEGGKLVCKAAVSPGEKKCNGLDNDCDGTIDDGPCPPGTICTRGACIPTCGTGEFRCDLGLVCDRGVCVEPPCAGKDCPDGQTCKAGTCVDACQGVVCPAGQFCSAGACIDACAFLKCASGEVCDEGLCKPDCACAGCGAGKVCDTTAKRCVGPRCLGKVCGAGDRCDPETGTCVDGCTGVVCPSGQRCEAGGCLADVASGDAGPEPDGGGGPVIGLDSGVPPTSDASVDASGDPGAFGEPEQSGGCGCTTPRSSGRASASLVLAALAAAFVGRRRVASRR